MAEAVKKEQRLIFSMLKIVPHKNKQPSSTKLLLHIKTEYAASSKSMILIPMKVT